MNGPTIRRKVGTLRPSQIIHTFGVGAIVDLPRLCVMVMGLDDWQPRQDGRIAEPRLLAAVQRELGAQVQALIHPPIDPEESAVGKNPFEAAELVGVPVAAFPRWMLCPFCRLLAPVSSGLFELKANPMRPDDTRYVHVNCQKKGKAPTAVPARFVSACARGHLDDFPWVAFVHRNRPGCAGQLRLFEMGATGEAADIVVKCEACVTSRKMSEAFGPSAAEQLPPCSGRRPHLRDFEPACDQRPRPILLGASNSWFPITLTALSIPRAEDRLGNLIEENWVVLEQVTSQEVLEYALKTGQLTDLSEFSKDQVWAALEKARAGASAGETAQDLKVPEWEVLSQPDPSRNGSILQLTPVAPPREYSQLIESVVLVERLREVQALVGFARIESPTDSSDGASVPADKRAPLARKPPTWAPASEIRGEGVFVHFREAAIEEWLKRPAVQEWESTLLAAYRGWRTARNLSPTETGFPGMRLALLHSFSHALMRQLAVECGYSAASIRERLYALSKEDGGPMAGVLFYTAAPDSEGTLGGLVALGRPEFLGRHIEEALARAALCPADPLCAEHRPQVDGTALHGAACHACMFAPETACERGNRFLDRGLLVPTVEREDLAFFPWGE